MWSQGTGWRCEERRRERIIKDVSSSWPLLQTTSCRSHWISEQLYKLQLRAICLREERWKYPSTFIPLIKSGPTDVTSLILWVVHAWALFMVYCQDTPASDKREGQSIRLASVRLHLCKADWSLHRPCDHRRGMSKRIWSVAQSVTGTIHFLHLFVPPPFKFTPLLSPSSWQPAMIFFTKAVAAFTTNPKTIMIFLISLLHHLFRFLLPLCSNLAGLGCLLGGWPWLSEFHRWESPETPSWKLFWLSQHSSCWSLTYLSLSFSLFSFFKASKAV